MANSKLQMPANYMALNESEMSCVEGATRSRRICRQNTLRTAYSSQSRSPGLSVRTGVGLGVGVGDGVAVGLSSVELYS